MPTQPARGRRQPDSAPELYFAESAAVYAEAAKRCGGRTFDLLIDKCRLRTGFASAELADELLPAVARLAVNPKQSAAVRLYAWDSTSTGVPLRPFPWGPRDIQRGGTVIGNVGGRFRTVYRDHATGRASLAMFDTEQRVGYFWFADHAGIHWYERAEPFRLALQWSLTTDRRFLAHASAVGDQRGAVLLTGKAGAGKTTTTLTALDAGLRVVGDNSVLISLDDQPRAHGLYGTVKLWPETLQRLPSWREYVTTFDAEPEEKLIIDVARARPAALAPDLPLKAVVVPEVRDAADARITRCSPADALLALAPSTLLQFPRVEPHLDPLVRLVKQLPAYRLELGEDLMSGPAAISALLDQLGVGT
jgi:hypothetical protein